MSCDICFEPFDHSIHKPYNLSCPHTYCLKCIQIFKDNKCPACNKEIKEKYPSTAILRLIPESNYDKLKTKFLKNCINLTEIKQDLKNSRLAKLKENQEKLSFTRKLITDKTNIMINILKRNEAILINKCDIMYNYLKGSLDELEPIFSFIINDVTKEKFEKNDLKQDELISLNNKITEITQNLIKQSEQIKKFEINYDFIENKSCLSIGEIKLKTVNPNLEELLNKDNQKGDTLVKLEECNKAIEIDPNNSMHYNDKGDALFELERYVDALECFNIAISLNPNDSYYYDNKGYALYKLERYQEAIECYNKAIQIDPNYSLYYKNKGHVLFSLKQYVSALECFDKTIEIDSNKADYYASKGEALCELGRFKEAVECYNKAIEINPNSSMFYNDKGDALFALKQYNEALKCFNMAIKIDPNNFADYYNNKGELLFELNRLHEAIECFNISIQINSHTSMYYNNKADALFALKEYDHALECYNMAIKIDSKNANY